MLRKIKWSKEQLLEASVDAKTYFDVGKNLGIENVKIKNHFVNIRRHLAYFQIVLPFETETIEDYDKRRFKYGLTAKKRYQVTYRKSTDPTKIAKVIIRDCSTSDKKKGLTTDLPYDFVVELIKDGCQYCEEKMLRMTLDRKDNHIGHIKGNVVGCCIRCNYLRGDIPYKAWMHIVPNVKEAVKLGLFEDWTGQTRFCKDYGEDIQI